MNKDKKNPHLLLLDLGNSSLSGAVYRDRERLLDFRIGKSGNLKEEDIRLGFLEFINKNKEYLENLGGIFISSVVAEKNKLLVSLIKEFFLMDAVIISRDFNYDIDFSSYDIKRLGIDRIMDIYGAKSLYTGPIMVCDMGTATTISVVESSGKFLGGMISAGVQLSLDALFNRTSALGSLTACNVDHLIGENTNECILSGEIIGTASMIDGLLERIEEELGCEVRAICTGGLARYVTPWCKNDWKYIEDLQFLGMQRYAEKYLSRIF